MKKVAPPLNFESQLDIQSNISTIGKSPTNISRNNHEQSNPQETSQTLQTTDRPLVSLDDYEDNQDRNTREEERMRQENVLGKMRAQVKKNKNTTSNLIPLNKFYDINLKDKKY